jgi:hypothetical protein
MMRTFGEQTQRTHFGTVHFGTPRDLFEPVGLEFSPERAQPDLDSPERKRRKGFFLRALVVDSHAFQQLKT